MPRIVPALLLATCFLSAMPQSIAQQTPPIAPKTVETPLPVPVQIPPPTLPPNVPARPLSADEAALVALRNQPAIAIARDTLLAQQGVTQQVRSGLLPTVTLSGSYTNVQILAGNQVATTTTGGTGGTTGSGGTTGTGGTAGGSTGGSGSTGGTAGGSGGNGGTTGTGGSGSTGGTTGGSTGGTGSSGGTVTTFGPANPVSLGQGFQATAAVRQLVFDFNHTRDLVRQSVAYERVALQNLTAVQANIVNQVKQAYYLLVQDERLVAENQANLTNRQDQLALARARLNSGLGLPSDVVTAETAVAQAIIGLNSAEGNAAFQRISLAQLMGIDPRTPITTTDADELPLPTNDVNGLVTTALQRRPEVLQGQANIDANRYGLNAARSTNAPVISGNLQFLSRGDRFLPGNDSISVGAAIQFSPFDGGLTAGKVKQARAELDSARASLTQTQLQVVADVTQAYVNLRSAEQRVTEATSEVQNAEEGVRIATGRYREGLGLFLDIINAQAFLLGARTDLVNARAAVDTARSAVQRAIGTPLPSVAPAPSAPVR